MNKEECLKITSHILNSYIQFRNEDDEVTQKVKSTIQYLEENLK